MRRRAIEADCARGSPIAQFTVDRRGRLLYSNAHYTALFGTEIWTRFLAGKERVEAEAAWQEALDGALAFNGEYAVPHSVGGSPRIQVICSATTLEAPFHGVVIDDANGATHRSLLRTLIDTLPDLVYVKDRQSRFLLTNNAHAEFFGVPSPDDMRGKCDHDFYPPEIADLCLADETQVMESGHALVNREEIAKSATGRKVWFLTTKVPLRDACGQVIGFVGLSRDITEQKEARIELERAARQLEDSNELLKSARDEALESSRVKSRFLANMSHEIRTPMNGLIGMTELLGTTALNKEQAEYVQTIAVCGRSLMAVINDILDFSKIEAGQLSIEGIELKPGDIVGEVLKLYSPSASAKGLELIGEVSGSTDRICVGDPIRLRQIMSNLVANAIKFTDRGYVLVTLAIEEHGDGVKLDFGVKDTGIGIPSDRLESIFDSFSQVDGSTTRRFGGTGLGLAICRLLVELMGGRISVSSKLGSGSEFRFELELSASDVRLPAIDRHVEGLRVLVCDDLKVNRQVIDGYLRRAGCIVELAESGPSVLERLSRIDQSTIDVLVLDYMMPEMDGLDVAKALRELPSACRPPILFLTSAGTRLPRGRMKTLGIRACLDKPILAETLLDAVATCRALADRDLADPIAASPATSERLDLTVLVVEDNEINERVAVRMLETLGCTVVTARDGFSGVLRSEEGFDVILMDCHMPVMDGYDATREIRRREATRGTRVPIIALTANALDLDRQRSIDAGMDDHLSKPFTRSSLLETLKRNIAPKPNEASA
jgi:PAS domain S-box-containing protein